MKIIRRLIIIIIVCLLAIVAGRMAYHVHLENTSPVSTRQPSANQWQHSSERHAYPDINRYPRLWILVSKKKTTRLLDQPRPCFVYHVCFDRNREK